MRTQFWLIRHGETDWNTARRLQGWRDIPLNAAGIAQAQALARALQPDVFPHSIQAIVSSDLSRAMETARLGTAHMSLTIQPNPDLRERHFGIYEGADWETLKQHSGEPGRLNVRDPLQPIAGGETLLAFQQRIRKAFLALAEKYPATNLLIFAHGGVIDMVWRELHAIPLEAPRPFDILNTSINHFSISQDGRWQEEHWGQIAHLTGLTPSAEQF